MSEERVMELLKQGLSMSAIMKMVAEEVRNSPEIKEKELEFEKKKKQMDDEMSQFQYETERRMASQRCKMYLEFGICKEEAEKASLLYSTSIEELAKEVE